jgi:hypothetical protein
MATVTAGVTAVTVGTAAGRRIQSLVGWKHQRGALPSEVTLTEAKKEKTTSILLHTELSGLVITLHLYPYLLTFNSNDRSRVSK